jgi:hypothetical protein
MNATTTAAGRWAWRAGFAVAILGALAALLAGPYQFLLGNAAGSTAEAAREAPCLPGQPVDIMDSPHVSSEEAGSVAYNSLPPTSGPHFAFTVAAGVYDRPVADGLAVHALEHGHVVIRYAPATSIHEITQLERLARRYGSDVLLAPYPKIDHGIALTAWGRIDLLEHYDQDRVTAFIEALRGRYRHGWTTGHDCA